MSEADAAPAGPLSPPTVPDEQKVAPDVVETLARMVDEVTASADPALAERLERLIDLLISRGHLAPAHGRMIRRLKGVQPSAVRLSVVQDKRSIPSSGVDCASLLHLCKGRCCAMRVSLSEEDLAEHRLAWDLQQPYVLRRDPDHGYCSYIGEAGRCQVYDDRPATCRQYDCRNDPRVWLDWEQRIPQPLPWHLAPEAWLHEDPAAARDGGGETPGDEPPP
jgi:Fe-S-cluster containining protein